MFIYLFRHGMTDQCIDKQKGMNKNVSLNSTGRQQVENVSQLLKGKIITKIYSSPTLRTLESAQIFRRLLDLDNVEICKEDRIFNKQTDYEKVLNSFLEDCKSQNENIAVFTHGRMIKMLYSLLLFHEIRIDFTDRLEIDYGTLNVVENGTMIMFNSQPVNNILN